MSSVVNVVSNEPKLKNIILLLIVTVNVRTLLVYILSGFHYFEQTFQNCDNLMVVREA